MNEYMKILGYRVTDAVTGFKGIVTSIGFDLYGCVQCVVTPDAKDGKSGESGWFDHKRLTPTSKAPVMAVPVFIAPKSEAGPEAKPAFAAHPIR
jgi:hypothetical protein